uniref:Myosin motor domain-containing protein n=1 Tax=Corethron hystrix TaxID=216773 RepID=A0A7S1BVS6_9STRA|mmetsp:Transcript_40569/g.95255  ORF Transcript_40569/g.95255 Transcript_40569/m.95255 type:complete len:1093 (+) Transcript_40569:742-4020(+)
MLAAGMTRPPPSAMSSTRSVGGGALMRPTVAAQFSRQLFSLRERIERTTPHYIRCLKPNDELLPNNFRPNIIVDQLRSGGVLEAVKVSRVGYPQRYAHGEFVLRYGCLSARLVAEATKLRRNNLCELLVRSLARKILGRAAAATPPRTGPRPDNQLAAGVQMGSTKVFLQRGAFVALEDARSSLMEGAAVRIQAAARAFLGRTEYEITLASIIVLQCHVRKFLAVRYVTALRVHTSTVRIQTHWRRFRIERYYRAALVLAKCCQKLYRGHRARLIFKYLQYEHKARTVQASWRWYVARRNVRKRRRAVVAVQCLLRCNRARRRLRILRIEARDVSNIAAERNNLRTEVVHMKKVMEASRTRTEELLKTRETEIELLKKQLELMQEQSARQEAAQELIQQENKKQLELLQEQSARQEAAQAAQELLKQENTPQEPMIEPMPQSCIEDEDLSMSDSGSYQDVGTPLPRRRHSFQNDVNFSTPIHRIRKGPGSPIDERYQKTYRLEHHHSMEDRPQIHRMTSQPNFAHSSSRHQHSRQFYRNYGSQRSLLSASVDSEDITAIHKTVSSNTSVSSLSMDKRSVMSGAMSFMSVLGLSTGNDVVLNTVTNPNFVSSKITAAARHQRGKAIKQMTPQRSPTAMQHDSPSLKTFNESLTTVVSGYSGRSVDTSCQTGSHHHFIEPNLPPLQAAIKEGEEQKIMTALSQCSDEDINSGSSLKRTPLHIAAILSQDKVAQILLTKMAVANAQDDNGDTPLHLSKCASTVALLLDGGANPNIPNENGLCPIHSAVMRNDVESVKLLVTGGANVDNADDIRWFTPLHIAVQAGYIEMVRYLCMICELDYQDRDGNTPLHYVLSSDKPQASELLWLLLEHQANPNLQNQRGQSPMHMLCHNNALREFGIVTDTLQLLLSRNGDPNLKSLSGCTALHLALFHRDLEAAILLIKAGARLNVPWNKPQRWEQFWPDTGYNEVYPYDMATTEHAMRAVISAIAWPQDFISTRWTCMECNSQLNGFHLRRKHHCFHCGRFLCGNCASNYVNKALLPKSFHQLKKLKDLVRTCDLCWDVLSTRRRKFHQCGESYSTQESHNSPSSFRDLE